MKIIILLVVILLVLSITIYIALVSQKNSTVKDFEGIRNEWEKELLKSPIVSGVSWTASRPFIKNENNSSLMFKEVKVMSNHLESVDNNKNFTAESTGYSVAFKNNEGRWEPTPIYILASSVGDAFIKFKEMRDKK